MTGIVDVIARNGAVFLSLGLALVGVFTIITNHLYKSKKCNYD